MDLHEVYSHFLNLCKVLEDSKETTKLHDYLWFLQNMDKFDDFPINKKIKHHGRYTTYLNLLFSHLSDFYARSRPLDNIAELEKKIGKVFDEKYRDNKIMGWDTSNNDYIDE